MGSFPETYKDPTLTARSTFSSPSAGTERCLFVFFFLNFTFFFVLMLYTSLFVSLFQTT